MTGAKQDERRGRIEAAAYAVLREVGYKAASVLVIARRASASNETIYNWYGNKQGLFRALVAGNAERARLLLADALAGQADPLEALSRLGPVLLGMVTGERAVTLNRAAAADVNDTATLGAAIAEAGRDTIAPLVRDIVAAAMSAGSLTCLDANEAAEIYFNLLIGDLQIRRVIGVVDELPPAEIDRRSRRAFGLFLQLYGLPSNQDDTTRTSS